MLFLGPKSTSGRTSAVSLMAPEHIDALARECGATLRMRKFQPSRYFLTSASCMCSSTEDAEFKLINFHNAYNEGLPGHLKMTKKCIHKQIDSPESVRTARRLLGELLGTCRCRRIRKTLGKCSPLELRRLLEILGVDDIILVDGTEIDVTYRCIDNLDCKGKGRPHSDGRPARPGIKLHVAFSVLSQICVHAGITSAVGSEREWVLPNTFRNVLIIADRGYISEDLEDEIARSGNLYLIRGKSANAGTVEACYGSDGKRIERLEGKKLSEVDKGLDADMDVVTKTGHKLRLIQSVNGTGKGEKLKFMRTNIPRSILNICQMCMLYRLRWSIELYNKANKSHNSLKAPNSGKENVILFHVILSVIASILKSWCGIMARKACGIQWMSLLKLHAQNTKFKELLLALADKGKSTAYQNFKDLLPHLAENCLRDPPSRRDAELLKDLPLLLQAIVSQGRAGNLNWA